MALTTDRLFQLRNYFLEQAWYREPCKTCGWEFEPDITNVMASNTGKGVEWKAAQLVCPMCGLMEWYRLPRELW